MATQRLKILKLRDFLIVAKPGIVLGNLMIGVGAFCFGAQQVRFDWRALLAFAGGMALVVAASCVLNNYYDQDIDRKMKRTATRPSATGVLPLAVALPYAAILYVLGFTLLVTWTNMLTAIIGLFGALLYVAAYSVAKRLTHYATLLGTLPGATPPLAGYTAATGQIDLAAGLLFLLLVAWQMPHFYAIAIFRREEYAEAGVPVLPLVKGIPRTVREMRVYGAIFVILAILFAVLGGVHITVGLVLSGLAGYWFSKMSLNAPPGAETAWARRVFFGSLSILPALSGLLIIDRWL